jgi:hypothetical protein
VRVIREFRIEVSKPRDALLLAPIVSSVTAVSKTGAKQNGRTKGVNFGNFRPVISGTASGRAISLHPETRRCL